MAKEAMYKPFPSETKMGLWVVAKLHFMGTPNEKFVPNESVHFLSEAEAKAEADKLNQEYVEDELLKEKGDMV